MKITILTLFPEMFFGPFDHSILKHAKAKHKISIEFINIRDFGIGKHKIVDDKPYGGGAGMVMRADCLANALEAAKCKKKCKEQTILLDPQGTVFSQQKAEKLRLFDHLILICSHYEGVDERFRALVDEELSIGDYVLTGGEIPAMVITDAVLRLLPGVLGKDASSKDESFQFFSFGKEKKRLLEYPHYTRPAVFAEKKIPPVLLSGDHKKINDWRLKKALLVTRKKRPDLLREE